MKKVLVISLNSGGTMGHGKIISSLANFLVNKGKQVTILSDMPFTRNFILNERVVKKNIGMVPHENYTIGGMCHCSQKEDIYEHAIKNKIECVVFSTFFDLNLVKKFKESNIKTILLSYPIRDTYRLALRQNGAYATFDKIVTLYGPCLTDKKMSNEILVNPLKIAENKTNKIEGCDVLVTCGGGGRPSSKIFLKKAVRALEKVIIALPDNKLKIKIIKGNSKVNTDNKQIETMVWTKDFASLLLSSKVIISEAGFYTMLDLINYKKRAILVPGERIIDNQELRALKLEELGMGKIFFPFEKYSKLSDFIINELEVSKKNEKVIEKIKMQFNKYPELGDTILRELK